MKHQLRALGYVLVVSGSVACTSTSGESAALTKLHANAETQALNAKVANEAATQAARDYSYEQRAQFVEKSKRDLGEIEKELGQLASKVDKLNGTAKADAKAKLAAAQSQWTEAKKQLDRAESATESGWDEVQAGIKKAFSALKDSVNASRQWLGDKIAP